MNIAWLVLLGVGINMIILTTILVAWFKIGVIHRDTERLMNQSKADSILAITAFNKAQRWVSATDPSVTFVQTETGLELVRQERKPALDLENELTKNIVKHRGISHAVALDQPEMIIAGRALTGRSIDKHVILMVPKEYSGTKAFADWVANVLFTRVTPSGAMIEIQFEARD